MLRADIERGLMAMAKTAQTNRSESPETTSDHIEEKVVATSADRRGRGPVDAPGKRHRKAPPQEPIAKHMGDRKGSRWARRAHRTAGAAREPDSRVLNMVGGRLLSKVQLVVSDA